MLYAGVHQEGPCRHTMLCTVAHAMLISSLVAAAMESWASGPKCLASCSYCSGICLHMSQISVYAQWSSLLGLNLHTCTGSRSRTGRRTVRQAAQESRKACSKAAAGGHSCSRRGRPTSRQQSRAQGRAAREARCQAGSSCWRCAASHSARRWARCCTNCGRHRDRPCGGA